VSSAVSAGSLEQVALASPPLAPARSTTRPRQSSSPFRGSSDPYPSHQQHHVPTDETQHNHSPYGSPSRKALNLASSVELVRPPTHLDRERKGRQLPWMLQTTTSTSTSSAFDAVYGEMPSARSSPAKSRRFILRASCLNLTAWINTQSRYVDIDLERNATRPSRADSNSRSALDRGIHSMAHKYRTMKESVVTLKLYSVHRTIASLRFSNCRAISVFDSGLLVSAA
jgi:hypothetical protein